MNEFQIETPGTGGAERGYEGRGAGKHLKWSTGAEGAQCTSSPGV